MLTLFFTLKSQIYKKLQKKKKMYKKHTKKCKNYKPTQKTSKMLRNIKSVNTHKIKITKHGV